MPRSGIGKGGADREVQKHQFLGHRAQSKFPVFSKELLFVLTTILQRSHLSLSKPSYQG